MKNVDKLRWAVCNASPWIGSIALSVKWEEGASRFGTAHTDGKKIVFDPKLLEDTSREGVAKQKTTALHEVLHVALAHCERRGQRQPLLWNIACDDRVNRLCKTIATESKTNLYQPAPHDGWVILDFAPVEATAEEVYSLLLDKFKDQLKGGKTVQGKGDGQGKPCLVGPDGVAEPITDPELKELVEQLTEGDGPGRDVEDSPLPPAKQEGAAVEKQSKLRRALEDARDRGEIPGSLVDSFNLGEAKVNWRDVLVNLVSHIHDARDDYSYRRPNQSYRLRGYYVPTLHSPTCTVAIGLDTSGSIAREELEQFLAEAWAIISAGARATIIPFTGNVWEPGVETIEPGESPPESPEYPSGGTAFQPVFDYIREERLDVDAIVMLTDGHGDDPEPPEYPVLWLTTGKKPADFGIVVDYEV